MCRLYGKFASYLRRVLCKTRLIFLCINGPIVSVVSATASFFNHYHVWRATEFSQKMESALHRRINLYLYFSELRRDYLFYSDTYIRLTPDNSNHPGKSKYRELEANNRK